MAGRGPGDEEQADIDVDQEIADAPASDDSSLRDDIEAAFADVEEVSTPAEGEQAPEGETPEQQETREQKARDEQGRFAKQEKQPRQGEKASEQPQNAQQEQQRQVGQQPRAAPASWRPLAKEAWGKLPAEVRDEVVRREGEVQRVLQETAPARHYVQRLGETIQPYAAMIRAEQESRGEQYDPLRTVGSLLSTAALMRTGGPAQKAELFANLAMDYGLDFKMLDDAIVARMEGRQLPAQQGQQGQPAQFRDPRVDEMLARQEREAQAREQQQERQVVSRVEQWGSKKEFFGVLRYDMGILMDLEKERGVELTLDQAYERAAKHHPEVSKVLEQRAMAERARTANTATSRSRRASSSVRPEPTTRVRADKESTSLREDIEAAFEEASGS